MAALAPSGANPRLGGFHHRVECCEALQRYDGEPVIPYCLGDDQRRRLAVLGQRLGRGLLREFATVVTPDTILRWHRELVARKWTYARRRQGRPGVRQDIRRLVVRMATDNPRWGYTRIQGALKNVGHRVARSTVASILRAEGLPPRSERPTAWRMFLGAHWPAIVAGDFFTTEVWTARGLVTYYTLRATGLRRPIKMQGRRLSDRRRPQVLSDQTGEVQYEA